MNDIKKLFERNKRWAKQVKEQQADFFDLLVDQQEPEVLWIGCSDSRVPANQIVNLPPGEIFVHRNIANVVVHTDLNCLSVLQYAVEVLKVKHVIVCGHYGCGGVKAALEEQQHGLIDNWLRHIKDVYRFHQHEMRQIPKYEQINRLCELNVIEQVHNIKHTTVIQKAWAEGAEIQIHGWIYNIQNGILKDVFDLDE
ncbi:MAG: carbonate dehydratase [bacterium]